MVISPKSAEEIFHNKVTTFYVMMDMNLKAQPIATPRQAYGGIFLFAISVQQDIQATDKLAFQTDN